MDTTRRTFLKSTAAAAGSLAFGLPAIQARNANEKINFAVIGSGGRGSKICAEMLKLGHNAVALCDIAEFRLEALAKVVVAAEQEKPTFYYDYRKLLEHKGLDAVIISTPDHHHKEMLVAAMQAEKDAYCEKPMTKSIDEGAEMVEAVRKANRVVQIGNQRHSGPHWEECAKAIKSNAFGKMVNARVWDCRNWTKKDPFAPPKDFQYHPRKLDWDAFLGSAPKRPFDPVRYFSWRWYWDYAGGLLTDIGAHQLDIVQWLGGVDVPKSAVANGGVYHFKHWETPDVVHGVWDYGKFSATFSVQFVNGAEGVGACFFGTNQTLIGDAEGELKLYDTADKILPTMKPIKVWISKNETDLHVKNWADCVKSRDEPNSPVELGQRVILAAHLANLSYRTGKKIFWDADRKEVIGR